jgi:hypothetical protein
MSRERLIYAFASSLLAARWGKDAKQCIELAIRFIELFEQTARLEREAAEAKPGSGAHDEEEA